MDATGFGIMTIVFMTMFGENEGPAYFRKFMDFQLAREDDLFMGMKIGASDVTVLLNDTDKVPLGWVSHVNDDV